MTSVGMVFTAPDRARAVFLTMADIATLQQSIAAFRQRPTVAGPSLPATIFDELSACLDRAEQPEAQDHRSVALTESQQRHLELLMAQAAIHATLPPRIRRACTACGSQRIVNPALPKQRQAGSDQVGSIVSSVQLLSEGHPILAGLTFLANATGDRGAADGQPICERCEGVDFSDTPVTFCPGCHELRAESILLTCPHCGHAFAGTPAEGVWTTVQAATDAFALARNIASLRDVSGQFENGLYPEQLTWLVESLGPNDELICLCRCGLPTELRYVALLLTSEQLVWSRQTVLSSATGGRLAWRDVSEVRSIDMSSAPGIEIVGREGNVLKFANFRGSGLTFGGHETAFTAEGMRARTMLLHTARRAGPAIQPAQPARPPAASTPAPLATTAPPLNVGAPGLEPPTTALVAAFVTPLTPSPAPAPVPSPQPPAVRPVPAPMAQPPAAAPPTPPPAAPPPQPPAAPPPQPPAAQQPQAPSGWYADPWRVARLRWWDGARWTGHIAQ